MIFKINKNNNNDAYVSNYSFEFIFDEFSTKFYQSGNEDLNLFTFSASIGDKVIEIRKNEDEELYNIFDEFYNSLDNYRNRADYNDLFEQGYFSWKSDEPANEEDWGSKDKPFIYNYLNIFKEKDCYRLVLVNNIKEKRFVINFNTSRSRYGPLVFPIWELFQKLQTYNPSNVGDVKNLAKTLD